MRQDSIGKERGNLKVELDALFMCVILGKLLSFTTLQWVSRFFIV